MRLRPLLIAMVATVLVLTTVNLVLLAQEARGTRTLDAQQAAAEKLARDAAGLLVLTQDYMLHGSSRSGRQWVLLHQELRTALRTYSAASPPSDPSVLELETVIDGLPTLFDSLSRQTQDESSIWARRELLTDQLINETRLISDGAFRLADQVNERRRNAELRHGVIDLATLAVLLALVGVMAWLLLRRVLWPIGRLGETARRMKAGDLDARTGYSHPDELGQLAEGFDAMAGTLQERDLALQALNRQLMQSESFLDRVSRIAGVGGWSLDLGSRVIAVTPQTLAIFALDAADRFTLDDLPRYLSPQTLDALNVAARRAIVERVPGDLELPFTNAYGRERWMRLTSLAEYEGQRAVRLVGSLEDVTERRELAEVLRQAKRDAEAANEAKSLFLANMSHEIRTPLNAVIGVTNLLAVSPLSAEQSQLLRKAQLAGQSLLGIVNDVLDLAKIEAGELTLDLAPVRLGRLITEKATLFLPQTLAKGVQLEADLPNDLPTWVMGDALRIGQVVNNLLSNAVKFTDRGHIRLAIRVLGQSPAGVHLRCEVSDTGIGIGPEARERLFRPFTQADASTTRRFGGTGLGLSIVRHLVELMGGTCGMDSEPGQGSTFWFALTLEPAGNTRVPAEPGLPVLITGGTAADRQTFMETARTLGWKPVEVPDPMTLGQHTGQGPANRIGGGVVIALWRSAETATTTAIKALDGSVPGSPAVVVVCQDAVSHIALPQTGLRVDQVLSAPVEPAVLFDAVNQAVTSHRLEPQVNTSARWLQGLRVLLVDDSEINRDIGQRLLELQGASVRTASHGREALERLQAEPAAFDVVLMDVQMPEMDGLQATRLVRATPGLEKLPVVALTAGALVEERRRALASGMNAFLSKPLDMARLVVEVRRVIAEAGGEVPEIASAGLPCATTSSPADWPPVDGIDMLAARQLLSGDHALFMGLLDRFLRDTASLPGELPTWARDRAADRRQALLARLHKLRGAAGALGANDVAGVSQRLELALRQGMPTDDLTQALADALARLAVAGGRAVASHAHDQAQAQTGQPPAAAPTPQQLLDLAALLQRQDLDALDRYGELAAGIRQLAGDESESALRDAVQSLDFVRASALLDSIAPLASAP